MAQDSNTLAAEFRPVFWYDENKWTEFTS